MRHRALLAGVERASMEETAECPDTVGVLEAMAIDRPGWPAMLMDGWCGGILDARRRSDEAVQWRNCGGEADVRGTARGDRRRRPLVGRVAAKPTVGLHVREALRSCLGSSHGWCANGRSAFQYLNDDHRRTTVPADEDRRDGVLGIVGLGGGFRHDVQQFTHLREAGAAHGVGQQSVVTDAMEAAGQHMQQEMK